KSSSAAAPRQASKGQRAWSKATEFPIIHFSLTHHARLCLFCAWTWEEHTPSIAEEKAMVASKWLGFLSMLVLLCANFDLIQRVRSSSLRRPSRGMAARTFLMKFAKTGKAADLRRSKFWVILARREVLEHWEPCRIRLLCYNFARTICHYVFESVKLHSENGH